MPRNFYRKLKSGAELEVIIKLGMPIEFQCGRAYSLCKLEMIVYSRIGMQQSLTHCRNYMPGRHNCWHDCRLSYWMLRIPQPLLMLAKQNVFMQLVGEILN
jgi:hypothetical protein